jgi:hypothetical protein
MSDLKITTECLSDLRIDQLLGDELSESARVEVQAHLAGCTPCRARRDDFAARCDTYLAQAPSFGALAERVDRLRADRTRARGRPRARTALFALAAAAAVLLALRSGLTDRTPSGPAAPREPELSDGTRGKGVPELGYFVKRGDHVVLGEPGRVLRPGDRLRFTYTSSRAQQFALLNRDGRGTRVYYPTGTRSAAIAAGEAVALDFSVELDDYVGSERVLAVFCEEPFDLEPLRRAFDTGEAPRAPAGCTLKTIELHKEAAP